MEKLRLKAVRGTHVPTGADRKITDPMSLVRQLLAVAVALPMTSAGCNPCDRSDTIAFENGVCFEIDSVHPDNDADTFNSCSGLDPSGAEGNASTDPNCDCDDTDITVHPEAAEVCDGQDNDCDGSTDEGVDSSTNLPLCVERQCYEDLDGDGQGSEVVVNSPDNACDGVGESYVHIDCDDADPSINTGAVDECFDGIDNDCDGSVDECGDGVMSEAARNNLEDSPYSYYGQAVTDGRFATVSVQVESGCAEGVYFSVDEFTPGVPAFTQMCAGSFEVDTVPVHEGGTFSTLIALGGDNAELTFSTLPGSTSVFGIRHCDAVISTQPDALVLETDIVIGDESPCGPEAEVAPGVQRTVVSQNGGTLAIRSSLMPDN